MKEREREREQGFFSIFIFGRRFVVEEDVEWMTLDYEVFGNE